ncbi:MAG: dTDP-4-dehydrorhamnose reductase [Candidatus Omnitrophica bacterium]|nr:dTDP-4-dehydrorhamnose reductase [Candidatus Omnitrophota bacterium]
MGSKVVVTGATGMLGRDICLAFSGTNEVISERIDITDREAFLEYARSHAPQAIINTAAIADVDRCEREPAEAFRVNAEGAKNVADAAAAAGAILVHISTDYVFDGEKAGGMAYTEEDRTGPLSSYGKSKLTAEGYVKSSGCSYAIIRSSWMFGPGGKNFVDSVIETAQKCGKVRAISEKYGGPTYTADLAGAIRALVGKMAAGGAKPGIYNISNSGVCSRYQFAKEILDFCGITAEVVPITAKEAGGTAIRPRMTELDNSKIEDVLGYKLRHYTEAFKEYIMRKRGNKV